MFLTPDFVGITPIGGKRAFRNVCRQINMRTKITIAKRLALAALVFGVASSSYASQEGILAFSSFRLESNGIGSSGKIKVEGKQNDKAQIVELKIRAFGKDYVVPPEKLGQLSEQRSNGVRISYEAGYEGLGGRTVYIQLQMGFTSHTVKNALITITESGKIEVSKTQNAALAEPGGAASGSQPIRSEASRTSSTAVSRR